MTLKSQIQHRCTNAKALQTSGKTLEEIDYIFASAEAREQFQYHLDEVAGTSQSQSAKSRSHVFLGEIPPA